jgi:hypothetical protein
MVKRKLPSKSKDQFDYDSGPAGANKEFDSYSVTYHKKPYISSDASNTEHAKIYAEIRFFYQNELVAKINYYETPTFKPLQSISGNFVFIAN